MQKFEVGPRIKVKPKSEDLHKSVADMPNYEAGPQMTAEGLILRT
jgi:hypothetical protein